MSTDPAPPARIQLSRTNGFRLHQHSHALNGLECRRVDRSTPFGNPFRLVSDEGFAVFTSAEDTTSPDRAAALVRLFRDWLEDTDAGRAVRERARKELRGKDLACWCGPRKPCHADVLLEIANA